MVRKNYLSIKKYSFVYFGGSDFAAQILRQLIAADWVPALVITSLPQPTGRLQKLTASPVARLSSELHLPLMEVKNLGSTEVVAKVKTIGAKFAVLAALGMIVPPDLITAFPDGIINIHPSLLPKWRGPSPMQYTLLNGDKVTGVSLILLDSEIDHGPIIYQEQVGLNSQITYPELSEQLSNIGANLIISQVPDYLAGKLMPVAQKHQAATFCKMILRTDGKINWQRPTTEIFNKWRAFTPWPRIYADWTNRRIKFDKVTIGPELQLQPGLVARHNDNVIIACGQGSICPAIIQLEGSKIAKTVDFVNGHQNFIGTILK